MSAPSPNGRNGDGRDARGRFTTGNPGGPGNPYARRVAELRSALLDAVTPEDVAALARALLAQAKGGDVAAARLVLSYAVGRPPAVESAEPEADARRGVPEDFAPEAAAAELLALLEETARDAGLALVPVEGP